MGRGDDQSLTVAQYRKELIEVLGFPDPFAPIPGESITVPDLTVREMHET
jgi:hypothetical protein